MKLGAVLKWGYFNKRRGFERVAQEVLQWDVFITYKGSRKVLTKI
jgi:hypothetical protein